MPGVRSCWSRLMLNPGHELGERRQSREGACVHTLPTGSDPMGRLGWASPALPGAVHDATVALIDVLAGADVTTFSDKDYQGATRSGRRSSGGAIVRGCRVGKTMLKGSICGSCSLL